MLISVLAITGQEVSLEVEPNDSVATVKAKVHTLLPDQKRLLLNSEPLDDGKPLSFYNISEKTQLVEEQITNFEESLELGHEFNTADALSLSEVYFLLKEKEEKMKQFDLDSGFDKKLTIFNDSLDYAKRFGKANTSKEANAQLRNTLTKAKIPQYCGVKIADLLPETTEEALTLIPELQSGNYDDVLQDARSFST